MDPSMFSPGYCTAQRSQIPCGTSAFAQRSGVQSARLSGLADTPTKPRTPVTPGIGASAVLPPVVLAARQSRLGQGVGEASMQITQTDIKQPGWRKHRLHVIGTCRSEPTFVVPRPRSHRCGQPLAYSGCEWAPCEPAWQRGCQPALPRDGDRAAAKRLAETDNAREDAHQFDWLGGDDHVDVVSGMVGADRRLTSLHDHPDPGRV